jgi:hypothetical protein
VKNSAEKIVGNDVVKMLNKLWNDCKNCRRSVKYGFNVCVKNNVEIGGKIVKEMW